MGRRKQQAAGPKCVSKVLQVEGLGEEAKVTCTTVEKEGQTTTTISVSFLGADSEATLHWGRTTAGGGEWQQPDDQIPPNTTPFGDKKAAQTPFVGTDCTLTFNNAVGQAKAPTAVVAPEAIAFVVKQTAPGPETWWKQSGNSDFVFTLAGGDSKDGEVNLATLAKKFCESEATFANWSQFQRFCQCLEFLGNPAVTFPVMSWITTVLRLANLRHLDWFRNYNYQPKDFCHIQETLAASLAKVCAHPSNDHRVKALVRLNMTYIPRGNSSSGDQIRMTILNIMRNHGIKEGHRAGIECKFLEQWHQKLHTNSAADDIAICEAHIRFLDSGNVDDFWNHMAESAHLTREKLATMGQPITDSPLHLPQMRNDMQDFLGLLKSAHSGADLDFITEVCKGQMSHDAECMAFDILHNRHAWWVAGKINECRRLLVADRWKRDVLMLDCALENWQLTQSGAVDVEKSLNNDDALGLLTVLLESLAISRHNANIDAALAFFVKVRDVTTLARWSEEWCRLMLAALERIAVICMQTVDTVATSLQDNTNKLVTAITAGTAAMEKIDPSLVAAFGEEASRSLPEPQITRIIRKLTPILRLAAGLGVWDVISTGKSCGGSQAVGTAVRVTDLAEFKLPPGKAAAVVSCSKLTGWEDIPMGIEVLLAPPGQNVDVLSHIAIRARTQKVLLACCADATVWADEIEPNFAAPGKQLAVTIDAKGGVRIQAYTGPATKAKPTTTVTPTAPATATSTPSTPSTTAATVPSSETSPSTAAFTPAKESDVKDSLPAGSPISALKGRAPQLVLSAAEISQHASFVGGKSKNLVALSDDTSAESAFLRPSSVCLPFGVFEDQLAMTDNKEVVADLAKLTKQLASSTDSTATSQILSAIRKTVVEDVEVSEKLESELKTKLSAVKLDGVAAEDEVVTAIQKVWASKWTDRAVSSRQANKIKDDQLYMAVLVQNLIDADYAFVIHTQNPMKEEGAKADVESLIEVVVGLGEPLVGNAPGRALSAAVALDSSKATTVKLFHYPSKDVAVLAPSGGTLMCRSDSNGEDLPNFAGAGLYDSFPVLECRHEAADYANEKLIFDASFRDELLKRLFWVGQAVLKQQKSQAHQDIEGCVRGKDIFVLQTRAQM